MGFPYTYIFNMFCNLDHRSRKELAFPFFHIVTGLLRQDLKKKLNNLPNFRAYNNPQLVNYVYRGHRVLNLRFRVASPEPTVLDTKHS